MNWEIITKYPSGETEQKWFDFMPTSTFPCHYTSPGFFAEPFFEDKNPFAVLIYDQKQIVGVATGIRAGRKILCGLEVRPQVSIAKSVDQRSVANAFVEAFLTMAAASGGELVSLNCSDEIKGFEEKGFSVKRARGAFEVMMLDLRAGKEAVFKGFSQTRRSDLRKAMREDKVQISRLESLEDLAELYAIHVAWCERKGIAPNSRETMERVLALKDYHCIFIAKHAGKIIAGSYFRFYKNSLMEYAANNSLPEYQRLRPNDLIVWRSIEWACEREIPLYSMGGSHLFLRRFGGAPASSFRYQLDRTFLQKHRKKEAVADFAIKTYQSLPVETRRLIKKVLGKQ